MFILHDGYRNQSYKLLLCLPTGRLGHGDELPQTRPKFVRALEGKTVVQVACGSRDAQTLVLTDDESVYSFGDGDFGKLGRGGSEGWVFTLALVCMYAECRLY